MIDLDVLDKLARDHLQFEVKCSKAHQNVAESDYSSDSGVVCALHRMRNLVMEGYIEDAVRVCEALCSCSISDARLQLDVRIHKFCELICTTESVRTKDGAEYAKAVHEALHYAQQLASFALNAFPEAYEIFTDAMMLFAFPEQAASPEAIRKRRERVANQLVSLARFSVCARESSLSFLIRYLLLIYVQFNTPLIPNADNEGRPVDSLVSDLLCCESNKDLGDSLITWKTDGSRPHRSGSQMENNEADIQALRERASITRQESLESLSFANGNLVRAMKNELGRVVINQERIRRMVVEYCATRGLKEFYLDVNTSEDPYAQPLMPLSPDQTVVAVSKNCLDPNNIDIYRCMKNVRELSQKDPHECVLDRISLIESFLGTVCTDSMKFRMAQRKVLFYLSQKNFEEAIAISQSVLGPLSASHSELFSSLEDTMTLLVFAEDSDDILRNGNQSQKCSSESCEEVSPKQSQAPVKCSISANSDEMRPELSPEDVEETCYQDVLRACNNRVTTECSFASIIEGAYASFQTLHGGSDLVLLLKALLLAHQNWETQNMMNDQLAEPFAIPAMLGHGKDKLSSDEGSHPLTTDQNKQARSSTTRDAGDPRTPGTESREQTILVLMEFMNMSRAEAIVVLRNHPQAASTQSILDSLLGSFM